MSVFGGSRLLKASRNMEIICDGVKDFRQLYRMRDEAGLQMTKVSVQALQSLVDIYADRSMNEAMAMHKLNLAKADCQELLLDVEDFLHQHHLDQWSPDEDLAKRARALGYMSDRTYQVYRPWIHHSADVAANLLICILHQTTFLLDRIRIAPLRAAG